MAHRHVLLQPRNGALSCRAVAGEVTSVRLEWEEAYRRLLEAARDEGHEEGFRVQLEAVTNELRRRVGGTFTLVELVDAFEGAEIWVRETLSELGVAGWARTLSLVEGAAFHLYSRGAVDYAP